MLKAKTPLRAKQSLRAAYAEKLLTGKKEYRPLRHTLSGIKTGAPLQTKTDKVSRSSTKATRSSVRKRTPKNKLFSILAPDFHKCYICGDVNNIHIHHIFGAANKANSEKYGFLVPLRADWHNMSDYGVHFNKELDLKLKRKCQDYWLEHIGTKEDFIATFGKWW